MEARLDALEKEVARMRDERAIEQLMGRYASHSNRCQHC